MCITICSIPVTVYILYTQKESTYIYLSAASEGHSQAWHLLYTVPRHQKIHPALLQ